MQKEIYDRVSFTVSISDIYYNSVNNFHQFLSLSFLLLLFVSLCFSHLLSTVFFSFLATLFLFAFSLCYSLSWYLAIQDLHMGR